MSDIIIAGILFVWLLLTVVCQFQPNFKSKLKWPDFFLFVMSTRLFTRMPCEMYIWYRDQPINSDPGPWQRLEWQADKSWISLFWAPRFWRELHLYGILNRVLREKKRKPRAKQIRNLWYHLVVAYVQSLPRQNESKSRQFRIVQSDDRLLQEDHTVLFTSEFHSW